MPNCDQTGWEFRPDGKTPLSMHDYELVETVENVTVEILRCKVCGHVSIGWYRTTETHGETKNE